MVDGTFTHKQFKSYMDALYKDPTKAKGTYFFFTEPNGKLFAVCDECGIDGVIALSEQILFPSNEYHMYAFSEKIQNPMINRLDAKELYELVATFEPYKVTRDMGVARDGTKSHKCVFMDGLNLREISILEL